MVRLQFRDVGGANLYEVPINPSEWNINDSVDYELRQTVDGSPVYQTATRDQRVRFFTWDAFPDSDTTFKNMVTTLRSYRGQLKEMNAQDIDYLSFGWKRIRIIDVKTIPIKGGELRYRLQLYYYYDEAI